MKESYVDVLVIGAGPAGLMAANGFAKAGVNVRVVDKRQVSMTITSQIHSNHYLLFP